MYMCDEIFWEWYLSLKMKFICFMYILFTQPENNLAHYFYSICALTKTHHVKSSIEFSICGVKLMPKKFWVLEQFGFQIFKLDTHSLYATLGLSSQYFSIAVEANYRELSGLKHGGRGMGGVGGIPNPASIKQTENIAEDGPSSWFQTGPALLWPFGK